MASPVRRLLVAAAVVVLSALTLTACGKSTSTGSANLPVKKIAITFTGSDVTPNGTDIDVKVGQPLEFDVTADKPGEIHVHSSPQEQEFEYKAGTSTFEVKPVPAPSRVTVESHTLNKTLFILVAR